MRSRALFASETTQRHLVLGLLLAAAAGSWGWLWLRPGMDSGMAMGSPTMGLPAAAFLAMWVVMMAAMMFPAAAPMVLMFHRIQSGKRERGQSFVSTWVFVAGYMLVWTAAGIVAYVAAIAGESLAARAGASADTAARIGGGLMILAGAYQLSPWKHACLAKCRSPVGFLMSEWRDGAAGALRMGVRHGAFCLGCCWLLFAIMFPLGIMNIAAMVLITLVVFAEKAVPWGRVAVFGTAIVLIAYGAIVLALPRMLPTFAATSSMNMPGMTPQGTGPTSTASTAGMAMPPAR